ncbi:GldG family protein [Breznakiella homolactica]|uniref:GldG family protein n=1 Tax=Breznakiella homolactica TaxID=2798577 RepID=A0A7T7XKP4_9SPIR|nr:Gldg family protein [Breznakiella homolactica]QQO07963.1 GldG family protein [Breznakiella homolactica]
MNKRQAMVLSILSVAAIVLGLLLSRRLWFRLDLTKNKAYTIAEVSRNLHREIEDQVRITYFLSDRLAKIHPVPGEIEDLLREYSAYSRGKIQVTVRDPAKAGLTATVEQLGILPQQIQSIEQDQASVSTVYSGVLIEYLDQAEVLPFVFSLDTLEYDLSSRIRHMVRGTQRELGVIAAESDKNWGGDYAYLNQALVQSGYRVRLLTPGDEIPDTLPLIIVLGGAEELDEWDLYRIDRYIQGGGKALFALETITVDSRNNLQPRVLMDQGLLAMVSYYGATVRPELVLDQSSLTIPFQSMGSYNTMQVRLVRYPHWISVLPQNGSKDHPITAGFAGVDLFWANPISLNPPESVDAEILFTTTPDAWRMTRDFETNPDAEYLFFREQPDTTGTEILAAALSGTMPSWFEGVPKPVREGSSETLPDMPRSARESRIVVVGDSDLATTLIQYTRSNRNLNFLLQAVDWLGNDDDIIGIRNREPQAGRLDSISDPVERGRVMLFSQILNVVIIPLGVIALGTIRFAKRKSRIKEKEPTP